MFTTLNNNIKFPLVGLGTYRLRCPHVEQMVEAAINEGYRLIDTAGVYRNESHIGVTLQTAIPERITREEIFVTSKMAPDSQGADKSLAASLLSLHSLQLEYLDLYLIHWPGAYRVDSQDLQNKHLRRESWLQLEKCYKEGLFKSIGVSNYTIAHLEELLEYCSIVPAVLQVELHPYLNQSEVRRFCAENGIHVQAYSSLGSSKGCAELMSDPVVVEVSTSTGKTCAQVLLRWAVQQNISVIPKTSDVNRLKENFDIFDFSLSDDQMEKLSSLDKGTHYCWDPTLIV